MVYHLNLAGSTETELLLLLIFNDQKPVKGRLSSMN